MTGRTKTTLAIAALTVIINLGANLLLIPRLSINGAALAWLISLVVSNLLTSWVLYRDYRLHPFGPVFFPVVVGSVCLVGLPAVACRAALGNHLDGFVIAVLISVGLYGAFLWVMRDRFALGHLISGRVAK
jgi:O-antigen/teichoic acid export membrane protein